MKMLYTYFPTYLFSQMQLWDKPRQLCQYENNHVVRGNATPCFLLHDFPSQNPTSIPINHFSTCSERRWSRKKPMRYVFARTTNAYDIKIGQNFP